MNPDRAWKPLFHVGAWSVLRLGIGAFLAISVTVISLLLDTPDVQRQATGAFRWILLGLSAPAMIILGYPLVLPCANEIATRRIGLNTSIALCSFAAFAAGAANTVRGSGGIYFDVATMLPVLATSWGLIEAAAKSRAGRSIRRLEALLAGPVPRVEADGEPLLTRRMIDAAAQARHRPSASEQVAERIAAAFVPAVLALAVAAGVYWLRRDGAARAGAVVLAVLAAACPTAIRAAASLATASAIDRAARMGILVRGGDVLERIARVDTVFFDKTGTLTTARPTEVGIESLDGETRENEVLSYLAGLESLSEHALARAIVEEARRRGLEIGKAEHLQVFPGLGVSALVTLNATTHEVRAGKEEFVRAGNGEGSPPYGAPGGIETPRTAAPPPKAPRGAACTTSYVGWAGRIRGRIMLADAVRGEAAETLARLHHEGIATALMSGDRIEAARAVADAVGIERVEAPRRPDEKAQAVRSQTQAGSVVAMVGDGINDAPALAAADVGVSLGAGTDVPLGRPAGHVVLLSNRLGQVPWLIALARRTRRIVTQNLLWAVGCNAVALTAAAAGSLHPLPAALATLVSSIIVLGNSLRIQ